MASLGKTRTAQIQRDARIGEAQSQRDAGIKEAIANQENLKARYENDTEIAKAKRDYEIKKAAYDIEVSFENLLAFSGFIDSRFINLICFCFTSLFTFLLLFIIT